MKLIGDGKRGCTKIASAIEVAVAPTLGLVIPVYSRLSPRDTRKTWQRKEIVRKRLACSRLLSSIPHLGQILSYLCPLPLSTFAAVRKSCKLKALGILIFSAHPSDVVSCVTTKGHVTRSNFSCNLQRNVCLSRKNSRVTPHFATAIVVLRVARKVERPFTFRNVARQVACV